MRNRYTPGIRHSSVFCCCNVFFDNCYVSEISEMISCAPGFCSLTCFWKQANGTFLRQKMSPVCWILLGCQRQKWGGGTMAWFHRCFLRELGGCNGRVWAKTVVDFRLLMIFGWVFGGLFAKSTLDDAKLITDHFILNLASLPNLVVICSGWDVSFIGHVRNEGQVMLPHANQLHSWEILNFEWEQDETNNNYRAW